MPVTTGSMYGSPDNAVPGELPTFQADDQQFTRVREFRGSQGDAGSEAERTFGNLSREIGSWTDRAAENEGIAQGKVAGLDPNYRPDADMSIMGMARRNAADATYGNQLETQARGSLNDIYQQYAALPADQRNPGVLQGMIQKSKQDFDDNHVFPTIKGQFDAAFGGLASTYMREAVADQDARLQDQARASFLTNQNSARDTAMRVASLPSASDAAIVTQVKQHDASIDEAVNQGIYSAAQAVSLKEGFKQDVLSTRIKALYDSTPDDQKPAFANAFMMRYASQGERDLVIRTVAGEAGGEGPEGQAAVANVIKNRVASGIYGKSVSDVVLSPAQFSLWNPGDPAGDVARRLSPDSPVYKSIGNIVDRVFSGAAPDNTHGADHYYNPAAASPDWGPQLAQQNDVTIGNHRFVGQIGTAAGAVPLSDKPESAEGQTSGLDPKTVSELMTYMGAGQRAMMSRAEHVEKAQLTDIGGDLKQMEAGFAVPDAEWAAKRAEYGASSDPVVAQAFSEADRVRTMFQGFKGQTPAQVDAQVEGMKNAVASGATPDQARLIEAAQGYASKLRTSFDANPLGRAAQDGIIPPQPPLDFSNPQNLAAGLKSRMAAGDQVASRYGVPAPYVTPDDKEAVKAIAAAGGEPMVQAAATIAGTMGPRASAFFSQVGGEVPSFAQMGRIAAIGGDPGILRDGAWAVQQDHIPGSKVERPSNEVLAQPIVGAYGDAFRAIPDFGLGARTLASSALAATIAREGLDPKNLDPTMVSQTLQKAAGATFAGSTQYGGVGSWTPSAGGGGSFLSLTGPGWSLPRSGDAQKVLLPPGLRADQFSSVVKGITDGDLASLPNPPQAPDGTMMKAADLQAMRLTSLGPGVYAVSKGDPLGEDPQWVTTPGAPLPSGARAVGGRFLLDLNALEPQLRDRLPGAWK